MKICLLFLTVFLLITKFLGTSLVSGRFSGGVAFHSPALPVSGHFWVSGVGPGCFVSPSAWTTWAASGLQKQSRSRSGTVPGGLQSDPGADHVRAKHASSLTDPTKAGYSPSAAAITLARLDVQTARERESAFWKTSKITGVRGRGRRY